VTPQLERLPLNDLGWDAFQAFGHDLLSRMPGVRACHHYGKQGDTQLGVDLYADFESGERWAFQNKRCEQFGPADAEKVVQAATFPADRYIILLSREATAGVRNAVDKYPKWEIWDVRDISQKVRGLLPDTARNLLDHHFGAVVRRAFLDVPAVSTFLTQDDFFRPLLDQARLFHHSWALVGRGELLQSLHVFVGGASKRIAVLSGRGGIGKTKLLHAFAQDFKNCHPDQALRFLAEGLRISPDSFDDLPMTSCVVVVDDAHRRGEDVSALLALAQQRRQSLKVILAARPEGIDLLKSLANRAGFDEREISRLGPLGDLTREETKQLARQALGGDYAHLADRLTLATRDCPLVTVVGGKLLAESAVDPVLLERLDEFQSAVLTKFHEVLIGAVGDRIDPRLCRSLLYLLAAVAPVRPDSQPFQDAASDFLGCGQVELVQALGVLEDSEVLLRRGDTLRITPDVLADHLLYIACLDPKGRPTGFVRQIFDRFASVCLPQVLRNFAELDWRVHRTVGQETDLLSGIWQTIEDQFRAATNSERCQLLDLLRDVAYYQPRRMLEMVQFAMRNPATIPEIEQIQRLSFFTHERVLDKLPELLKRISYTLDYLPCCADLLWELGRDDTRKTNPHPEHPMRVLREMAEYHVEKSFAFNRAMLEAARRWFDEPGAHDHAHSPLDVLDPLFAKAGHTSYSEGYDIRICTFKVPSEETQDLRDEALALVRCCALDGSLKVTLRALKSLEDALHVPYPFLNVSFSQEELAQWVPEQLQILGILKELRQQATQPAIHLRINEVVGWCARFSSSPDVKQQARAILASAPDSFEVRLSRALAETNGLYDHANFDEDLSESFQHRQERQAELCRSVAQELWQRKPDLPAFTRALNEEVQTLQGCGRATNVSFLLEALLQLQPEQTESLAEVILGSTDSPLAGSFALLVAHARHRNISRGTALAQRAVQTGHVIFCRALANLYCWNIQWSDCNLTDDLNILQGLLAHPDLAVKRLSIDALRSLGRSYREAAITTALSVELGTSGELAAELCAVFSDHLGIPPASLSPDDIATLLRKLEPVDRLDHHVTEFLAFASTRQPCQVVDLLLSRVERGEREYERDFEPLPYLGLHHHLAGLADSQDYVDILRLVRDRSLEVDHHSLFWFPKLFAEVSLDFCSASLTVLLEWTGSRDARQIIAATALLRDAPAAFVFDQREFVSNVLGRAYAAGEDCYRRVCHHLRHCTTAHGRSREGGGPFPQDITLQDRATTACRALQRGSPEYRFYESLMREAVTNIRDAQARDEEMMG
jgi:hypothetical protein